MEKIIEIKNLHKNFGKLEVLKGVNLDIYKGEVISIIGSSGSGKSTLLRCINLLEYPTSGNIYFNNLDIVDRETNIDQIREKIGKDAFFECYDLTSVVIPNSVISIGDDAFCACRSLASIKYCGTEEEWEAIAKGNDWDRQTGSYTVIYNYSAE